MAERFTLLSELGRGGMGVVWKARDEETGQILALKVLRDTCADDPGYLVRFERELELARRINSKHVVRVLGYGTRDGCPYIGLEYIDGPSLRERILAGPIPLEEAKGLLIQITEGLVAAHAMGVIHRDLKPANIMITSGGVAKIGDFGVAKGLDMTRVTRTSTLLGTPTYLPPEGPEDVRSDLYSLGVIAYEMLAGVPPFEGNTYQEVILRHVRDTPNLARIPGQARQIVGWLLAKDPRRRPQSARELLATLTRTGEGSAWAYPAMAQRAAAGVKPPARPPTGPLSPLSPLSPPLSPLSPPLSPRFPTPFSPPAPARPMQVPAGVARPGLGQQSPLSPLSPPLVSPPSPAAYPPGQTPWGQRQATTSGRTIGTILIVILVIIAILVLLWSISASAGG